MGNIREDTPVKVWMATTDKDYFTSSDMWEPYAKFVLVFNGYLDVTQIGEYDVMIRLDTPFDYTGKNLVIMTSRVLQDSGDGEDLNYGGGNRFFTTQWTSAEAGVRTIAKYDSIIDLNPAIGYSSEPNAYRCYPNIKIIMGTEAEIVTLRGKVQFSPTEPVLGAKVTYKAGVFTESVTTIADGSFEFRRPVGDSYTITIEKDNYQTVVINDLLTMNTEIPTITLQKLYPVQGIVFDGDGELEFVYIVVEKDRVKWTTESYEDGSFMLYLVADTGYKITFSYGFIKHEIVMNFDVTEGGYDFGFVDLSSLSTDDIANLPVTSKLKNNYPNPFNPETTIEFTLGTGHSGTLIAENHVRIEVFNIRGQKVRTLVDRSLYYGEHRVVWNGKDDTGNNVGSGVYFYRLTTPTHSEIKKMIMIK